MEKLKMFCVSGFEFWVQERKFIQLNLCKAPNLIDVFEIWSAIFELNYSEFCFWNWVLMRSNNMWLAWIHILKIEELGELFEEETETLNKNVVCAIKKLQIYKAL